VEMDKSCVTSYKCIHDICDYFGGWHLLEIFSEGGIVHQIETFCIISSIELTVGLCETAYEGNIEFVVLVDCIFSFSSAS